MAWIESHQTLGQHPKTRKLARLLNISVPTAVGHLQFLWWWALDYAPDGSLERFEDADIADAMLWEGNAEALVDALRIAGFVDVNQIHDWDTYLGRLIDKRAANAERARESRERARNERATNAQRAPLQNRTLQNPTEPVGASPGAVAPKPLRRRITDEDVARWEGAHPTVDIQAMVRDYENWTGSSKHTDKVLGFENQLRDGWRLEKFRKQAVAVGQNVNEIHQRNLDLERVAWERKNPGVPYER